MSLAFIGLGSNLGDRWEILSSAIRRLRAEPGLRVVATSRIYETVPVDCPPASNNFLNAVLGIETERSAEDVLRLLLRIECEFGRVRTSPNSPRTLDLDLLLFDRRIAHAPDLTVPHPRLHARAFVLVPLAEIAPEAVHPVLSRSIRQLRDECAASERESVRVADRPRSRHEPLAGLNALVTGSSSGIGAAIASEFRLRGARVIGHGRQNRDGLTPFIEADLGDTAQQDRLAAEAWVESGGLDILVCNAGADTLTGTGAALSFDAKLETLLAVDLKGTMRLARDIGARMKSRGRGSIITIGWDQAETGLEGDSGQLFAAVKGAVMCFTRSLALGLAPEVRVNCIAPGWIRTAWGETAGPEWQQRVRSETPLGIWGLPEDVAEAAAWLAGPAARFVTGQTIRINGGAIR